MTGDIDDEMTREEIQHARLEIQERIEALNAYDDLDLAQQALEILETCDGLLAVLAPDDDEKPAPREAPGIKFIEMMLKVKALMDQGMSYEEATKKVWGSKQ